MALAAGTRLGEVYRSEAGKHGTALMVTVKVLEFGLAEMPVSL